MTNLANGIDSAERGAAAAISADIRDRADPTLVRADRVEQLYSQLPLGMVSTIVLADIALLIPLFYGVSVAIAFRLNGVFLSGYRLRHAYQRQLVELQEARRQIEASGRKLALFAERSPIAVLELDAQGTIHEVNQAAELLFGYAADELAGQSVRRLVKPKHHPDFERDWSQLMKNRAPLAGVKVRNPRRDGIDV